MSLEFNCQECAKPYRVTAHVARKGTRFCSWPCRQLAVARENKRPLSDRFWEKVDRRSDHECWPWIGGCFADGYGAISVEGKPRRAPRVSFELSNVYLPPKSMIRHKCDNKKCVNPSHLETGTHTQNMRDMSERGRHVGSRKLTDKQVQEIRDADAPLLQLADMYGVSVALIGAIRGKRGFRLNQPVTMSKRREKFG